MRPYLTDFSVVHRDIAIGINAHFRLDGEQAYTYDLELKAYNKSDSQPIGSAFGMVIDRDAAARGPGGFHFSLDAHTAESSDFATTLFNNRGELRAQFIRKASLRRGSGVWGPEVNTGLFLFIEKVEVKDGFVGKDMDGCSSNNYFRRRG